MTVEQYMDKRGFTNKEEHKVQEDPNTPKWNPEGHHKMVKRVRVQGNKITGVDIPFIDLVTLLVKVSIAAIPAAMILGMIGFGVAAIGTIIFTA